MSKYHFPWDVPHESSLILCSEWLWCLIGRRARVTFSYKPEQGDELALEVGDIITNIVDVDFGWCEGELNGKKGVFPNNFVEELSTPASEEVVAPQPTTSSNTGGLISFVHLLNHSFFNYKSVSFEFKI